jgi:hypothetical protein
MNYENDLLMVLDMKYEKIAKMVVKDSSNKKLYESGIT